MCHHKPLAVPFGRTLFKICNERHLSMVVLKNAPIFTDRCAKLGIKNVHNKERINLIDTPLR